MRRAPRFAWLGSVLAMTLFLPACGGGGSGDGDDTAAPDADPNDPPDADNSDFVEIIAREWTVQPGVEEYKCVGVTVPEDMWISVFRTANPGGEHHAVLTVADQPGGVTGTQLGEYDCDVGTLGLEMLFASGVGTDDLALPEGVAVKVEAGQFLHLNLHLFNTDPSNPITARSSILVKRVPQVPPSMEAEAIFAGTTNINVPPQSTGTASGGCTFDQAATIFAYWPHMHQAATHQKVTMTIGGQAMVIHDEDFLFGDQINFPLTPPLEVQSGDSINVECTYYNASPDTDITFGDSSNQEMCFTGLYRYPKQAFTLFDCSDGIF